MFVDGMAAHISNWLREWRRFMEEQDNGVAETLKNRLLDPIKVS